MLLLLIMILVLTSLGLGKTQPFIASVIDLVTALLILFFRVMPGRAGLVDWILMIALLILTMRFMFSKKKTGTASGR